ncbi:MAG: extensin family protein [Methylocystis sp.]|nr:extensin family protein [Methylocystis sp.]
MALALAPMMVLASSGGANARHRRHWPAPDQDGAPRVYADVPLPPERPVEYSAAEERPAAAAFSQFWPQQQKPQPEDYMAYAAPEAAERPRLGEPVQAPDVAGAACLARLRAAGVEYETAEQPPAPIDGCHIPTPIHVSAVSVNGRRVSLPAKPLVDCAYALQFADFADRLAAPLGPEKMRAKLVAFDTGPGYDCRSRNHVHGARLSAHGKGIALDVSGFEFSDGRRVMVEGQRDAQSRAYFASLRKGACNWFTTVLGPGSDGHHERHLHFDIEQHGRHGMHYCR